MLWKPLITTTLSTSLVLATNFASADPGVRVDTSLIESRHHIVTEADAILHINKTPALKLYVLPPEKYLSFTLPVAVQKKVQSGNAETPVVDVTGWELNNLDQNLKNIFKTSKNRIVITGGIENYTKLLIEKAIAWHFENPSEMRTIGTLILLHKASFILEKHQILDFAQRIAWNPEHVATAVRRRTFNFGWNGTGELSSFGQYSKIFFGGKKEIDPIDIIEIAIKQNSSPEKMARLNPLLDTLIPPDQHLNIESLRSRLSTWANVREHDLRYHHSSDVNLMRFISVTAGLPLSNDRLKQVRESVPFTSAEKKLISDYNKNLEAQRAYFYSCRKVL